MEIKQLLDSTNRTYPELAKILKVNPRTIRRWAEGVRTPSAEVIAVLQALVASDQVVATTPDQADHPGPDQADQADQDPVAQAMFARLVEMRRSVRVRDPEALAYMDIKRWGSVKNAIAILYSMRGYNGKLPAVGKNPGYINWAADCPFGIKPAFEWKGTYPWDKGLSAEDIELYKSQHPQHFTSNK